MYYVAMGSTVNLRLNESLSIFAQSQVGEEGDYDTMSEYIRDLIRKDKLEKETRDFEIVKRHLQAAFAQPLEESKPFDEEDFLHRAKQRRALRQQAAE